MMQTIVDLARVLVGLFFIGLPVMFCLAVTMSFAVDKARKRTIKMAEEAGVEITLKPDSGPPTTSIEGIIYCIGFIVIGIIIVIAAVLGISFPLDLSEDLENIIGTTVTGVFDVLIWTVIIWSPFYYRTEQRRLQQKLDEALRKKD
jgi:hypothetical protein